MLSPFMRNRVLILLNHQRETALPQAVWINCSGSGMNEQPVEVPVTVAEIPDTIIHKLAARVLLGDLERGESYIHAAPNAPSRGSAEERELVRREGEKLGCRWSLVSKWTSFVAVEEAVDEDLVDEDALMDRSRGEGRDAPGDGRRLNLLRPRGDRNVAPRIEGHAEQIESDVETRDSSGDESDTVSHRNGSYRRDDSDDSGDDQGPGHGGQGHGNAGGRDVGPGPRRDHDRSHRENRSHSSSAPGAGDQPRPSHSIGGRNLGGAVAHGVSITGPAATKHSENAVQHRPLGVDDFFNTSTSLLSSAKPQGEPREELTRGLHREKPHKPKSPSLYTRKSSVEGKPSLDKKTSPDKISSIYNPYDRYHRDEKYKDSPLYNKYKTRDLDDTDNMDKKSSMDKSYSMYNPFSIDDVDYRDDRDDSDDSDDRDDMDDVDKKSSVDKKRSIHSQPDPFAVDDVGHVPSLCGMPFSYDASKADQRMGRTGTLRESLTR